MYILGSFAFSACLIGQLKFFVLTTCLVIGMDRGKAMQAFHGFERDRKKANRKMAAMLRMGLVSEEDAVFRKDEKASAAHKKRLKEEEEARQREWMVMMCKGVGKRKDDSNQGQAEGHTSQGGLQYKGEGKGGSLGRPCGPSRGNTAKVANGDDVVVKKKKKKAEEEDWMKGMPAALPKYADDEEIWKHCFETKYFYKVPFWDGKNIWSLINNSHALWKKAPVGPRGGQSTKTEVFHAQVHGWERNEVGKWDVVVS